MVPSRNNWVDSPELSSVSRYSYAEPVFSREEIREPGDEVQNTDDVLLAGYSCSHIILIASQLGKVLSEWLDKNGKLC